MPKSTLLRTSEAWRKNDEEEEEIISLLNQARAGFLEIILVRMSVCMFVCVCVCVSAPEAMNN